MKKELNLKKKERIKLLSGLNIEYNRNREKTLKRLELAWKQITDLSSTLHITKSEAGIDRSREMILYRVREHIPKMRNLIEQVITEIEKNIKERN